MPDLFKFKANDTLVMKYLNSTERGQVQRWQMYDNYNYEFHTGHTTGDPIYVRPTTPTAKRWNDNVPKFDTNTGVWTGWANGPKLENEDKSAWQDAEAVRNASFASLCLLAKRYWRPRENPVPQVVVAPPVATHKPCRFPPCTGQVPIVKSGKAACPVCFQYQ
jgi:hypothetical protein